MPFRAVRRAAVVLALAGLSPVVAHATEAEIWVFVKIVDKVTEGQKIEIQMPFEILRKLGTLRFWDMGHEKVLGTLEGAQVWNTHKNLEAGKNEKVLTVKDEDYDLAVVISAKERKAGSAGVVNAEVMNYEHNQTTSYSWGLANLPAAVHTYFTSDLWNSTLIKTRIEGIERIEQCLEPLANAAPFTVIKIDGGPNRIIVKTD